MGRPILGIDRVIFPFEKLENPVNVEEFNGRMEHTPSSMKAELIGIAVALSLLKSDTKIYLGMDSVAAISAIVDYTSTLIYRKVTRYKYDLILELIKEMIRRKTLSLILYKIEAHSQYKWNDKTDSLVRMATE